MDWLDGMQNAIKYVEEHLTDDIDPDVVAAQAFSSTFHFLRTFHILTGFSLAEYIRKRRLTQAALELTRTEAKVIDMAVKYGYETPEAFSRAFLKQHGVNPSAAKSPRAVFTMFSRLSIQVIMKGEKEMNVRFEEKEAFSVQGVRRNYTCENGENFKEIPVFWQDVMKDDTFERLLAACADDRGVMGVCGPMSGDRFDYWIAADCAGNVPDGMESFEIPAATWAVFESVGPLPNAIQEMTQRIYSEWFPASGYEHVEAPELELYGKGDGTAPDYKSWVWIPVKKKA